MRYVVGIVFKNIFLFKIIFFLFFKIYFYYQYIKMIQEYKKIILNKKINKI